MLLSSGWPTERLKAMILGIISRDFCLAQTIEPCVLELSVLISMPREDHAVCMYVVRGFVTYFCINSKGKPDFCVLHSLAFWLRNDLVLQFSPGPILMVSQQIPLSLLLIRCFKVVGGDEIYWLMIRFSFSEGSPLPSIFSNPQLPDCFD